MMEDCQLMTEDWKLISFIQPPHQLIPDGGEELLAFEAQQFYLEIGFAYIKFNGIINGLHARIETYKEMAVSAIRNFQFYFIPVGYHNGANSKVVRGDRVNDKIL